MHLMYKRGENGILGAGMEKVAAARILEDKGLHTIFMSVNGNEKEKILRGKRARLQSYSVSLASQRIFSFCI